MWQVRPILHFFFFGLSSAGIDRLFFFFSGGGIVNLGKWILRNLFLGFIREGEQAHSRRMRAAVASSPRTTTSNLTPATPPPPPQPHSPHELIAAVSATTTTSADGATSVSA